jgi:hypothetical protein
MERERDEARKALSALLYAYEDGDHYNDVVCDRAKAALKGGE